MALSKEQKRRKKMVQQGKNSPDLLRGSWNGINPIMKSTPTLVEKQRRQENKHKKKWNSLKDEGSSIFCIIKKYRPFSYYIYKISEEGRRVKYETQSAVYRRENKENYQKDRFA